MRKVFWFVISLTIALLSILLVTIVAQASSGQCRDYKVMRGDTMRMIAAKMQRTPGQVIKSNKGVLQSPTYTLYENMYLCLPETDEVDKKFPNSVIDAPAGFFSAIIKGNILSVSVENFGKKTNWTVKVFGGKIGKIKVEKKSFTIFNFKIQGKYSLPATVCLKNMTTDLLLCKTIR